MSRLKNIVYKKIDRISPSQFYAMKNCPYKTVLSYAFDKNPLLPLSANAYFGTVIHKILELISKNEIASDNIDIRIKEEIEKVETTLLANGYGFCVPLQQNVKDYGMKIALLKRHLRQPISEPKPRTNYNFLQEVWFESKDGKIAGKIDLVIQGNGYVEIIDFKSGAVTTESLEDVGDGILSIKEEYKDQLKLYAFLYHESTGKYPTVLSLVDLAKQKFNVEFNQTDCERIFGEALALLNTTNVSIDSLQFKANPGTTNCRYCLYRPACSYFLMYLDISSEFNDIVGTVTNVVKYQNGNTTVFLDKQNGEKVSIMGFQEEKYEYLSSRANTLISVFNLKKEAVDGVYSTSKTTMIYD